MIVTNANVKNVGKTLSIDFDVINITTFKKGMMVELEHGKKCGLTNITNNDLLMTGKIVLAHLFEFPDYYDRLEKMEERAKKYWKNREKPNIILQKK